MDCFCNLYQLTFKKYRFDIPPANSTLMRAVMVHAEEPKLLADRTAQSPGNAVDAKLSQPDLYSMKNAMLTDNRLQPDREGNRPQSQDTRIDLSISLSYGLLLT